MRAKYSFILSIWLLVYSYTVWASDSFIIKVQVRSSGDQQYVSATMQVRFSPEYFIQLLNNSDQNCEWMDSCKSVIVLKAISATEDVIRTRISVPWPFKDREMLVVSKINYDPKSHHLIVNLHDSPEQIDTPKNLVRMTNVSGTWEMKAVKQGLFELSYRGTANPQGNIPTSLGLAYLKNSTRNTFLNLKAIDAKLHGYEE